MLCCLMKTRALTGLFLATLLIAAQGALALHAFEHEPGSTQGKVCGACVTASQPAAGGVDAPTGEALEPAGKVFSPPAFRSLESVQAAVVRQRGPPSSS